MEVIEYFTSENKEHWLSEIEKSDWGAGQFLAQLLKENKLKEMVGQTALVLMLTDGDELVSFCTFAPLDDIQPTVLTPWIGFVYTFPEHRGYRYAGKLLDYAECQAAIMGKEAVYISTNHTGLYEKYGYEFYTMAKDIGGEDSRVYRKVLNNDGADKDRRMDLVAFCGLNCETCDARIATLTDDAALREKTAKLWSELNGVPITAEMINCEGCRVDGVKTPFCNSLCPIRQCALGKGFATCGDCPEMENCETVGSIHRNDPEAKLRLTGLHT